MMNDLSLISIRASCRNANKIVGRLFIFGVFYAANSLAGQATLQWNASPSNGVDGYKVYYGTATGNYTISRNAGNQTQYTATDLQAGVTYYFAVTAYSTNPAQESDFSNEVIKTIPPADVLLIDGFD